MNRFSNLTVSAVFFVSFFLSSMEENLVNNYSKDIAVYFNSLNRSDDEKAYETRYIACDLYNQDIVFGKLAKCVEYCKKVSDLCKIMDQEQFKVKDSRNQNVDLLRFLPFNLMARITMEFSESIEPIGFVMQTKDYFKDGFSVHEDAQSLCLKVQEFYSEKEHTADNPFSKAIMLRYEIDKFFVLIKQELEPVLEFLNELYTHKLKNGVTKFESTRDLDFDDKYYENRDNLAFLGYIGKCKDEIESIFNSKNLILLINEKTNLVSFYDEYLSKRNVYSEFFQKLKSEVNTDFNRLSEERRSNGRPALDIRGFKIPHQFKPFPKTEEELRQDYLRKKEMEAEAAKSFLPETFGNKKSQKRSQPKSKGKAPRANNDKTVINALDAKNSQKIGGNNAGKAVQVIPSAKPQALSSPFIVPKSDFAQKNCQNLICVLPSMRDKSYIRNDNGYVIDIAYDLQGLKGMVTDRILRIRRGCKELSVSPFQKCHSRVLDVIREFEEKNKEQKNFDENNVSHNFPACIVPFWEQSIKSTFLDKNGRSIANRIFLGEKFINDRYVQGLYIFGFFEKNNKHVLYHHCFKKRQLKNLIDTPDAEILTEDEKQNCADCLEQLYRS